MSKKKKKLAKNAVVVKPKPERHEIRVRDIPKWLYDKINEEAEEEGRSIHKQLEEIAKQHFKQKEDFAEHLNINQHSLN